MNETEFSKLPLKPDHDRRPIWTTPEHDIWFDSDHFLCAKEANEFLNTVADPVARPHDGLHRYKLTEYSLYAAAAAGIKEGDIIKYLEIFSKTALPLETKDFIQSCAQKYGKARLVLKGNTLWVESKEVEMLGLFLRDPVINEAKEVHLSHQKKPPHAMEEDDDDSEDDEEEWKSFPIQQNYSAIVKQRTLHLGYPLLEEYKYRDDQEIPDIPNMHLRFMPGKTLRPHQEAALRAMFKNKRARSGIIVLPCGAGKTLTGIAAAEAIRKPVLCICNKAVSVQQWKAEFLNWTEIAEEDISVFTSSEKSSMRYPCVLVTTYSMMVHAGKRAPEVQAVLDFILSHKWGLLLLDEVQTAPAATFRNVAHLVKAHCRLGLTATLVREDDLIDDLGFLVGPKLYEANVMDLVAQGHLARVQCVEVRCPLASSFEQEHRKTSHSMHFKQLLSVMNPNKARSLEYLVRFHEKRGDKIIIFSDLKAPLEQYAKMLRQGMIHGGTPAWEREALLTLFRENKISTLCLSRVGDMAINLPDANVVLQVSAHFGARQQEAQRLGRIMRPKSQQRNCSHDAWFYTLVSTGTKEVDFSAKRRQYLIDQGFTFKIITDLLERVRSDPLAGSIAYSDDELLEFVRIAEKCSAKEEQKEDKILTKIS